MCSVSHLWKWCHREGSACSRSTMNPDKKRRVKGIGERWPEQIAEDVVWDIVDEVDFYAQDGGPNYVPERVGTTVAAAAPMARGITGRDD